MSSLDAAYNVVSEVAYAYDSWGNRILEQQSHAGPVSEFTPAVQYVFDDGASGGEAKYVFLKQLVYPNGQVLDYGRDGSPSRPLSRIESIAFAGITNAVYRYLGLGTVLGRDGSPQPSANPVSLSYGAGGV